MGDNEDDNEIKKKVSKKKVSDVFEERKKIKSEDNEKIIVEPKVGSSSQNGKKDNKQIIESRVEYEEEKDEELKVETKKKLSMNDLKSSVKIKVNLEPENRFPKRKKKKIFTDEIKDELTFHDLPEAFDPSNELKKKKIADELDERLKTEQVQDEKSIIQSLNLENEDQKDKGKINDSFGEPKKKQNVESREKDEIEHEEASKKETKKKLSMNDLKSSVNIKVNLEPENRIPKRKKKKIFTDEIKDELTFHDLPEAFDQSNELNKKRIADEFEEKLKTEEAQDEKSIYQSLNLENEDQKGKRKINDSFRERKKKEKKEEPKLIIKPKQDSIDDDDEIMGKEPKKKVSDVFEERKKIKSKDDEKIIIKSKVEITNQNGKKDDEEIDESREEDEKEKKEASEVETKKKLT